MRFDTVWRGARIATLSEALPGLGIVEAGAIASRDGRICFAGPERDLPTGWDAATRVDLDGRWITPGLVDCHTHLVHAGDRAQEFELRLAGASYEEVARAGGGILSTVRATREASEDDLVRTALPRLDRLLAEGVTTVEVKSGYGLEPESENRMLRAARRLGRERPVAVATTYLGAHAFPPETDRTAYLDEVCATIPRLAADGLADAVDAFCEGIALSPEETARVFAAAREAVLPVKLHADQLSDTGGAALAAHVGALSADHLEYASEAGVAAMAKAGTVAVLLPGAYYTIRETRAPPVALFRRHDVRMAVATDCNPGSSPLTSPLLAMNMAATLFRLTVDEILAGWTREAARALGRLATTGTLEPGKWCDLAIWEVERPAELVYRLGFNPLSMPRVSGRVGVAMIPTGEATSLEPGQPQQRPELRGIVDVQPGVELPGRILDRREFHAEFPGDVGLPLPEGQEHTDAHLGRRRSGGPQDAAGIGDRMFPPSDEIDGHERVRSLAGGGGRREPARLDADCYPRASRRWPAAPAPSWPRAVLRSSCTTFLTWTGPRSCSRPNGRGFQLALACRPGWRSGIPRRSSDRA